jgi:hypothetical protein
LRCIDYMSPVDKSKTIAFVAKMVGYRPLALQLIREGLLNPNRVRGFLGNSLPRGSLLDFLMIVSDLARMSKVLKYNRNVLICTLVIGTGMFRRDEMHQHVLALTIMNYDNQCLKIQGAYYY